VVALARTRGTNGEVLAQKENLTMGQPQCTAKAKRTGQRCRRYARRGYKVCIKHGAGQGNKYGGRPPTHGRYSKFLTPEEVEDFEAFKQSFDLNEDLAFAATKAYHAVPLVKPEQLPGLLEVPSKIAMRRKQILEGVTLKVEIDAHFLHGFVMKVFDYVKDPEAQADLTAYLRRHLGALAAGGDVPAADA
jgi:hypothetical protein